MSANLMVGTKSAEVGNWQRFLNEFLSLSPALVSDEDFGFHTKDATELYQSQKGLLASGVVDATTRALAVMDGFLPFLQAKSCQMLWPSKRSGVDLIVIHTMEAPEKPKTAWNVASWFAGSSAPQASAHFCLDDKDVIQCVRETDIAWHAPGANRNGIGIEHAGYAAQTPSDWSDTYSLAVLENSAKLANKLSKRWNVPLVRLSVSDLKNGARGFCGHVDITNAFNSGKGHQDPGQNFPWNAYIQRVKEIRGVF